MLDDIGFRDYFFHIAPLWVLELTYSEYLELQKQNNWIGVNELTIGEFKPPKSRTEHQSGSIEFDKPQKYKKIISSKGFKEISKQEIIDFSNAIKDGFYVDLG